MRSGGGVVATNGVFMALERSCSFLMPLLEIHHERSIARLSRL